MDLEGKILGYNKKTVVAVIGAIVIAAIVFYAGTQYEKNKLTSLGLVKGKGSSQTSSGLTSTKKKSKIGTPANMPYGTTAPSANTNGAVSGTGMQNNTSNAAGNSVNQ